ncbi:DEAD/DEAH box helicase [Alicyclobacillus acidocaldarius]|uniref:SNF2-related protein n=1 Tax=Alicyclobacillus acidocaldarius (strain Tc-4-1) TaxID=1048834 RepID=F8IG02_ALIAT|nr:DEAD/DEAH box helicase [Alicyclobacillus acidocaldarius]AEJ42973.1 SNF2-related protein [Alicyclobacillus acidocaldarius subsp. acidocaldarius Tc-4-1]
MDRIAPERIDRGTGREVGLADALRAWQARAVDLARIIVKQGDVVAVAHGEWMTGREVALWLRQMAQRKVAGFPSGEARFVARWVPAWTSDALFALRYRLISYATRGTLAKVYPSPADVDALLIQLVDRELRRRIVDVELRTPSGNGYSVMYRGKKEALAAWARALVRAPRFLADGWIVSRECERALEGSGWGRADFDDDSGRIAYDLVFSLEPPGEDVGGEWVLRFELRHRWTGERIPLSAYWQSPSREMAANGDVLVAPERFFLPKLREAARLCPAIARALCTPAPARAVLHPDEMARFVSQELPALRRASFVVETPALEAARDIRIRVRLERMDGGASRRGGGRRAAGMPRFSADAVARFDWSVVIDDHTLTPEEFRRMVERQTPLVQVAGAWRLVPLADLLRQVEALPERGQEVGPLEWMRAHALAAHDGPGKMEVDAEGPRAVQWMDVWALGRDAEPEPPPASLRGALRHYQEQGYAWLIHLRKLGIGGCLADDMGLGKTVQMIAYWLRVKERGEASGPHLLVCPTSLVANWKAEIERFAPDLSVYVHHGPARNLDRAFADPVDLVITTYGTLLRDGEVFRRRAFDCVTIDEAQVVKNASTQQARALRALTSRHRVALTGTPVENRLDELWSLMDFLNPGYLGSLRWFRTTFGSIAEGRDLSGVRMRQLQLLLRPVLLRRRKSDPAIAPELPEKWEVEERALLTAEQAAIYQALVDQMFAQIARGPSAIARRGAILTTLLRLKQVCDHPALISGGRPSAKRSGKLRSLLDLLRVVVDGGEAALIFTQFREMGEMLCKAVEDELGFRPPFLHGGMSAKARGEIVEQYQTKRMASPVLVLSLRAGGVGLNLTRANHVFHYDRWWNPAVEDQATDRAYRIGQSRGVEVHKMICAGTLEERIDEMLRAKRALSDVVSRVSEDWVTELDDEALYELFALNPVDVMEEDAP